MAAASWLQSVFISRAFRASWSSCRVNWPALLPEGLQQMLQWRRRWRLPSRQLPLLVGHLSPEPRDRSPADRGGHEVSDIMGVFEICFWYESTSHKPGDAHSSCSRHADVSSYRSSYHITICILKMTAMIQSQRCWDSHHHCSQPLINSLIRNSLLPYFVSFFWFWNFSSSLSNIWVKILKNRFCSKVSVTVRSENNSRC